MHTRVLNVLASLDEPLDLLQGQSSFCRVSHPAERDPVQTDFLGATTTLTAPHHCIKKDIASQNLWKSRVSIKTNVICQTISACSHWRSLIHLAELAWRFLALLSKEKSHWLLKWVHWY